MKREDAKNPLVNEQETKREAILFGTPKGICSVLNFFSRNKELLGVINETFDLATSLGSLEAYSEGTYGPIFVTEDEFLNMTKKESAEDLFASCIGRGKIYIPLIGEELSGEKAKQLNIRIEELSHRLNMPYVEVCVEDEIVEIIQKHLAKKEKQSEEKFELVS